MDITDDDPNPCPLLHPLPEPAQPRLIDRGTLHCRASAGGSSERYGKGKTAHTIHVWWARRPFSAMRTLVFASLCPDQSENALNLAAQLGEQPVSQNALVARARAMLNKEYPDPPRILDMFGGGGTIAQEAATLGAMACSMDSNPLAVFIQKSLLEYSQDITEDLPAMVREAGIRVLERVQQETEPLFPLRHSEKGPVLAYLHTYAIECAQCGFEFFLTKRPWLSRKKGRETALEIRQSEGGQQFRVAKAPRDCKISGAWQKGKAVCPCCGEIQNKVDTNQCRDVLTALARQGNGHGKEFEPALPQADPEPALTELMENDILENLGARLPQSRLPKWSGIVNPSLYGINTHSDFLNPRQRLVLLLLIQSLRKEYAHLEKTFSPKTARCIVSLVSGLMDQLIDWNCRLSMWIPQNEQVGRAFCGPGVAMLWDYAETDPLLNGPANLWKKLDRIVEGTRSIRAFPHRPSVTSASAQDLPYPDRHFDAIVTDPPYYDNIFYSPLADFFYAWKKMLLDLLAPDLAHHATTESDSELVASIQRSDTRALAHSKYCTQLEQALCEASRVLKDNGVLSLVYSHGSLNGWDALVKAFRASPLIITSVQPLCIERKARPRAMSSVAVNTCLVFVARKDPNPKPCPDSSSLISRLEELAQSGFSKGLLDSGWSEEDAGLALFAQGVAMLANSSNDLPQNDQKTLAAMESLVRIIFPAFQVSSRKTL
ncbi:MAG: DUF1156 domain-containing protein [Desulfatibacillum sp.]|nr:DUF1156 domain-containing protein [Desulfatibacillum sp.]